VVAGSARGVPLVAPRGARPTTGRVREAVYSVLGDVTDASVLDLYAGSGALGIEALSRGARGALLVDVARDAAEACRRNLDATRSADRARVQSAKVEAVLKGSPPPEAPFDLVCCDPPYEAADDTVIGILQDLAAPGWLTDTARVLVERSSRTGLPQPLPAGWEVVWEREYGDTLVAILRHQA